MLLVYALRGHNYYCIDGLNPQQLEICKKIAHLLHLQYDEKFYIEKSLYDFRFVLRENYDEF